MAILQDTILDAQRPLGGGWLRRSAIEGDAELGPTNEDSSTEGMQTIFRFQKEGPARPLKASFQPVVEATRVPAGDPLSAGTEAARWKSPANTGIDSFGIDATETVSSRSELETGQEVRGGPSKTTAAREEIASEEEVRSLSVPGPTEAKLYRTTHKSEIPDGTGQPVSRYEISSPSRAGRGAPSETSHSSTAAESTVAAARAVEIPAPTALTAQAFSDATLAVDADVAPTVAEPPTPGRASQNSQARPSPPQAAGPEPQVTAHTAQPVPPSPTIASPDVRPNRHGDDNSGYRPNAAIAHAPPRAERPASPALAMPANTAPAKPRPAEPSLVIGRIDVVVVAREPQAATPTRADNHHGFLNRNYLKRL